MPKDSFLGDIFPSIYFSFFRCQFRDPSFFSVFSCCSAAPFEGFVVLSRWIFLNKYLMDVASKPCLVEGYPVDGVGPSWRCGGWSRVRVGRCGGWFSVFSLALLINFPVSFVPPFPFSFPRSLPWPCLGFAPNL